MEIGQTGALQEVSGIIGRIGESIHRLFAIFSEIYTSTSHMNKQNDNSMTPLLKWALIGTVVYIFLLLFLIWINWPSFCLLKPNEWGDFLGGVFGPLALSWIVVGYFLQREEFIQQRKALNQQIHEFNVLHVSNQQRDERRRNAIMPLFKRGAAKPNEKSFFIVHSGPEARNVEIEISEGLKLIGNKKYDICKGNSCRFNISYSPFLEGSYSIIVDFEDEDGNVYKQEFIVHSGEGIEGVKVDRKEPIRITT